MGDGITLAGVLLGLVGGVGGTLLAEVLRLRKRPKLSLAVVEGMATTQVGQQDVAYARLDVVNSQRGDGALGVSVRIDHVRSQGGVADESLDSLQGWQLAWANEDRGNPNVPPAAKPIPAGDARRIDLVHLNSKIRGRLLVDVRPQPGRGNHLNRLPAGAFTVELVVSGENASTRRFAVDVEYDGQDWDGESAAAEKRVSASNLREL